jgi:membrane associated rhomboid family serine protease
MDTKHGLDLNQIRDVPVSVLLAVTLVVIFSLYLTNLLKAVPCGKKGLSILLGNFVHIDFYHLMANLFALYSLSRIEIRLGWRKFIGLVLFLLVCNTLAEVAVHMAYPNIPCSIGFSGVLFGMMAWELVSMKQLDIMLLLSILLAVVYPSFTSTNVSLSGHLVGAISGVIGGLLWKWL